MSDTYADGYRAGLAERVGTDTIARVRAQGYRDGYARALADVQAQIAEAIGLAMDRPGTYEARTALQHVRAIVRGLREKARRAHG